MDERQTSSCALSEAPAMSLSRTKWEHPLETECSFFASGYSGRNRTLPSARFWHASLRNVLQATTGSARRHRHGRRRWWEGCYRWELARPYSNRGSFSGGTQSRMDRARPGVLSMRPLRSKVLIIS